MPGRPRAPSAGRRRSAAFGRTAAYDAAVAGWLAGALGEAAPRRRALAGRLAQPLRYGENPHQAAAFYRDGSARPGVATARQLQGKALSYNNINDTDAAFELVAEFAPEDGPACAIVKHANPCGVARGATLAEAYRAAYDCDRSSAFGGIVALNRRSTPRPPRPSARSSPRSSSPPRRPPRRSSSSPTRRTCACSSPAACRTRARPALAWRQVAGGFLVQDRDAGRVDPEALRVVTRRAPTAAELADLRFAWTVAKHVKSNAIVYARGGATVGIGAGQMSRVDATRIAAAKARDMAAALGLPEPPTVGAVVASDAFFPFADGLIAAAEAGATAVIQPGGSVRDAEVIAAADAAGFAMVFTGMRHFRH